MLGTWYHGFTGRTDGTGFSVLLVAEITRVIYNFFLREAAHEIKADLYPRCTLPVSMALSNQGNKYC